MAKISFGDIVALAKQGYKPADIKELMALDTPEEPEAPETPEPPAPTETPKDTETPAKATGQPAEDTTKDAVIEALKAKVAELQKTNQTANQSGNTPDPQKDLDDIVRSFM